MEARWESLEVVYYWDWQEVPRGGERRGGEGVARGGVLRESSPSSEFFPSRLHVSHYYLDDDLDDDRGHPTTNIRISTRPKQKHPITIPFTRSPLP